jgi:glycosyltransferase involved in cell wall biosynthesis
LPHIAHFISYTGTAMGGPVQGMAAYVGLLAEAGYPVTVYSAMKRTDGESVALDPRVRHVQEVGAVWGGFRRCSELWRQVQEVEMDLVHSYGLWTDVNRLAGNIAQRRSLPHVLAPCGMLAPGALRHHGWKKVPVRFWFQDRALREAQCLHAKSPKECEDLRRFGLRNPVALIPNPVFAPTLGGDQKSVVSGQSTLRSKAATEDGWSVVPERRTVLFLGRLHPVKGLARLVKAWAAIQETVVNGQSPLRRPPSARLPKQASCGRRAVPLRRTASAKEDGWSGSASNWQLVLAGPDEGGHRSEVESLVHKLGCGNSVIFAGQLDNRQKWGALAAADLFVMPSDFENFGNAIVEAMLSGLPVVTTTGTPWKGLPAEDAGWCVPPAVDALSGALREALAMPEEKRQAMGQRAAAFAKRFRPEQVAADLLQVYQWLLGRGTKPGCVV